MKMKANMIFTAAYIILSLLCSVATTASPDPFPLSLAAEAPAPTRSMQQSSSTDFLSLNAPSTLQAIESHLFSPQVQRNIDNLFQSRIQYQTQMHTYPSLQYTFSGFWGSWKKGMENQLLFAGDDIERNLTIVSFDERGRPLPDQAIIVSGFEYGLANMAGFLAQAMVDGIYSDKCATLTSMTEEKCESLSEEERWNVPIKKWADQIQSYSSGQWDYKQQLVDFVDGGMNRLECIDNSKVDYSFIHSVSGVFNIGCHTVDYTGKGSGCPKSGVVGNISQRRTAFSTALSALRIPRLREVELVDDTLDYLKGRKQGFEEDLLLYKNGEDFYRSQRYLFDDMVSAISKFSKPQNITHPYPDNTTTFFHSPDHLPFYMGDPYMRNGLKYGLGNIALFFANGLHLSIEHDDACDELNTNELNGKIPISNSCGQRGLSYQDMVCPDDDKACAVDENMELTAVTFNRLVGSAPPLTCAPTSTIPFTGYWNAELTREEKKDVYANENGRVDVAGCCWWGRGLLQTKGVCAFGRLNYYLGARAAKLGRPSLFPDVDFCVNPEAICVNQYSRELIWMTGLFAWVDRVQTYDHGGFNYMERLRQFADSGFKDEEFIKAVGNIVKLGCNNPPCKNAGCLSSTTCAGASSDEEDMGSLVTKAFRTFMELDLWEFAESPGGSNVPTPSPTQCKVGCTDQPTMSPLYPTVTPSGAPSTDNTLIPSAAPSSETEQRIEYFSFVKAILQNKQVLIEKEIFSTPDISVYTLDGFVKTLEDVSINEPGGLVFYLGQGYHSNLGHGIANLALFLAHASTRGLRLNTCDETTESDTDAECPMSTAAMRCPVLVDSITRRGILLNQSPCDVGRFNHIFGIHAQPARYQVDFCTRPEVICYDSTVDPSGSIQNTGDIKYLLGLIEWIDRIQVYSWGFWDYMERLKMFVDDGMKDFSFVDEFSEYVVKSPSDRDLRKSVFKALVQILFSELTPNTPSSTAGVSAATIPPNDAEVSQPISKRPVSSPSESSLSKPDTQPSTSGQSTPTPFTSNPGGVQPLTPDLPGPFITANTRVDLSSSSAVVPRLLTTICVTLVMMLSLTE